MGQVSADTAPFRLTVFPIPTDPPARKRRAKNRVSPPFRFTENDCGGNDCGNDCGELEIDIRNLK